MGIRKVLRFQLVNVSDWRRRVDDFLDGLKIKNVRQLQHGSNG